MRKLAICTYATSRKTFAIKAGMQEQTAQLLRAIEGLEPHRRLAITSLWSL
jgi:hypothetical protein